MMDINFENCPNYSICSDVSKDHQVHRETLEWHRRVGYYIIGCIVSVASLVGINTIQVNSLTTTVNSYIAYQKDKDERLGSDSAHTLKTAVDGLVIEKRNAEQIEILRAEFQAHKEYTKRTLP